MKTITLQLKAPEVGAAPHEFPAHSINTSWTQDGKISVIALVMRADGGVHIMQDIIEPPVKEQK